MRRKGVDLPNSTRFATMPRDLGSSICVRNVGAQGKAGWMCFALRRLYIR